MTTTRINHTGHNHPSTTAARTACRKASATVVETLAQAVCVIGKSNVTHKLIVDISMADCGAGLGRGVRRTSPIYRQADNTEITCRKCAA